MRRNALVKTRDRTNPSTQEAEAGRFQKQRQPQLHRKTSLSQKKKPNKKKKTGDRCMQVEKTCVLC
jgi:hypothetical protein